MIDMSTDLDAKYAEIKRAFDADRAYRDATARPYAETPADRCRYCGATRQQYFGTTLDGHSLCYTSKNFQRYLVDQIRADPRISFTQVAATLGVTQVTVRAWYRAIVGK